VDGTGSKEVTLSVPVMRFFCICEIQEYLRSLLPALYFMENLPPLHICLFVSLKHILLGYLSIKYKALFEREKKM